MSDFLITSNNVYIRLNDFMDSFYDEAELINEAKCQLINFGELEDMNLSKGLCEVYKENKGYRVYYNGISLFLEIEDKMITNYRIEK